MNNLKQNLRGVFLLGALLCLFSTQTFSQEEEDAVTTEELRKYAIAMEAVEIMKGNLSTLVNDMIREQEGLDGKRFSELMANYDDEAKLKELEIKDYERQFLDKVNELQEEWKKEINTVFKTLAVKGVGNGGRTYKKVKKALQTEPEIKRKYDQIQATIRLQNNPELEDIPAPGEEEIGDVEEGEASAQ